MMQSFACKNTDLVCSCSEMLESNGTSGKEDYVADSEDEATKNFKVRVCTVLCLTWEPRHLSLWNTSSTFDFGVHVSVIHSLTCLTPSGSVSCSQNATTRPSTARMFPLWGSTGNLERLGRIWCPFAASTDDELLEFFPVRFSKLVSDAKQCCRPCQ